MAAKLRNIRSALKSRRINPGFHDVHETPSRRRIRPNFPLARKLLGWEDLEDDSLHDNQDTPT